MCLRHPWCILGHTLIGESPYCCSLLVKASTNVHNIKNSTRNGGLFGTEANQTYASHFVGYTVYGIQRHVSH